MPTSPGTRPGTAMSGGSSVYGKKQEEDKVSFNLKVAKEIVFKEYTEGAPGRFKKFISTPLFDRLLHTCILLFVSRFQIEALHKSIEKYLRLKDDDKAAAAEQRIHLLEEEVQHYRADMAPLYGSILMTYSDYKNPHQDRLFFESLYDVLTAILKLAFKTQRNFAPLEIELGILFRTNHFNKANRTNKPARSVDTLSLRELHAIKSDDNKLNLNAKMLTALTERPVSLAVQSASVATSELIDRICNSSKYHGASTPTRPGTRTKKERVPVNPRLPSSGESSYAEQELVPQTVHEENSATMVGGKYKEAGKLLGEQRTQIKAINRQIGELQDMKEKVQTKLNKSPV